MQKHVVGVTVLCWNMQTEAEPPDPSFLFCRSWLRSTWFGYAIISTDPKTLQAQHTRTHAHSHTHTHTHTHRHAHTHTRTHTPTPTKYSRYYKTCQTPFKSFQRVNWISCFISEGQLCIWWSWRKARIVKQFSLFGYVRCIFIDLLFMCFKHVLYIYNIYIYIYIYI